MIDKNFKITLAITTIVTIVLSSVCFVFGPVPGTLCLLCGTAVCASYIILTKKRFKRISELNEYLSAVCSGNLSLDIPDNCEGELSILKNNLYKIIATLRFQNDKLSQDKLYLADSMTDISHQLKTPLTSMMVMSDILKDEQSTEKRSDFVDIIQTQLEKMRWLVQNLLKLSRLDAGTVEIKRESLSAAEILENSAKAFLVSFELREIDFSVDGVDFDFIGDYGWITEAISNIIKNALEHITCGGKITVTLSKTALFGMIEISDNGCGMDEEDLRHIFERFYRGKNSSPESVGIGLALTKAIVESHNGKIEAESEPGKGTKFKIFLPLNL